MSLFGSTEKFERQARLHVITSIMAKATTKKLAKSGLGAPSQYKQSSRKGKKAWRKNVDIQEVEEGLEESRAEERVAG